MASVSNSLTGLDYLMQPGGPLSNLPPTVTAAQLQSASPEDVATLSMASLETRMWTCFRNLTGCAKRFANGATPQQQVQNLFGEPATPASTLNLLA